MAHPSPRRKGWRAVIRVLGLVVVAAVAAIPASFVTAMLLTPVLWRLEPVLRMELAGHSGPADWIITTIFGVFTAVLSIILLRLAHGAATRPPPAAPATREPS